MFLYFLNSKNVSLLWKLYLTIFKLKAAVVLWEHYILGEVEATLKANRDWVFVTQKVLSKVKRWCYSLCVLTSA